MRFSIFFCFLILIFGSCGTSKKSISPVGNTEKKSISVKSSNPEKTVPVPKYEIKLTLEQEIESSFLFQEHFVGFHVYDPSNGKSIIDINANKSFTPASNIKLYTLYACLAILDQEVPIIQYAETPTALYFRGTGNPGFLHPRLLIGDRTFEFLNVSKKQIYFDDSNFKDKHFGSGWAWDDASYTYQCEKSSLPIFGNVTLVQKPKDTYQINVIPPVLAKEIIYPENAKKTIVRDANTNAIQIKKTGLLEKEINTTIPFKYNRDLILDMLSDTLNRTILFGKTDLPHKDLIDDNRDELYALMMQESDNMIAEQLLLMCSHKLSDSLTTKPTIRYIVNELIDGIPKYPKWVDGSGLSRYNLGAPSTFTWILEKLERRLGREVVELYFPEIDIDVPNLSGPIIYAKTGSLSNNFSLSGYMTCKSGKQVLFSFMNNHFKRKRSEIWSEMKVVLRKVYENN